MQLDGVKFGRLNLLAEYYYTNFESHNPKEMAIMPITMLLMVYKAKFKMSPFFKNEWFSSANVENVVKPPQNPVANNKVWFCER